MASTFSPNLRLELIGTGEQQGTWGATTNTNLGTLLEEAIGGYVDVTVSNSGDTTLTTNNGSADQSRNMVINLTGTISATRNVICPAIEKLYVVKNATTGGFAVTLKVSGQTGVSIPNGTTALLYVDGTDVRAVYGSIASQNANSIVITGGTMNSVAVTGGTINNATITGGSISGITSLALADGGTGANLSDPNANAVLGWNDTSNTMRFFTAGTGIAINATSNTISSTITQGGNYAMQVYTNTTPGGVTWTKPANLVAVKVTVVGGGGGTAPRTQGPGNFVHVGGAGGGGSSVKYIPAPSIPGPVTVTVGAGGSAPTTTGGTSSFGAYLSATGGAEATATSPSPATAFAVSLGGNGGAGSNGSYNLSGGKGGATSRATVNAGPPAIILSYIGAGGGSLLSSPDGPRTATSGPAVTGIDAVAGLDYGGGASGEYLAPGGSATGGSGGQGIVIVEEFY